VQDSKKIDAPLKESGFDLKDFVIRYSKYLPLIILGAVIAYFVAKIKLRYTPNIYAAAGTMLIKENKQSGYGDSRSIEELFTSKSSNDLNTEMELMRSRYLMKRVVKSLNLQTTYYNKGKVKTSLMYGNYPFELRITTLKDSTSNFGFEFKVINENQFEIKGSAIRNFNQVFTYGQNEISIDKTAFYNKGVVGQKYIVNWQTEESASGSYGVRIAQVGDQTRVLSVSMSSLDPKLCADVVNTLMREYTKDNLEENKTVSDYTQKFINDRVTNLEKDLKTVETNTKDFRERNNSINLDAQSESYLTDLNEARKSLSQQLVSKAVAQNILDNFNSDKDLKEYAPYGLIDDPNIQNIFLEYNNTQIKRKRNIGEFGTTDEYEYKSETEKLKMIKKAIVESLTKLVTVAESNNQDFQRIINENTNKLKDIPGLQNELLNFGRNQKVVEELYLFLKKKGEENGITSAATVPNSRIIDQALVNGNPIEPVASKIISLALFLGVLIPAALAYLLELFNDKIRFREDIEKQTATPIIAEVGHNEEEKTLIVTNRSRKVIAEQFRMIRTNLQYLVGVKDKFTVLTTSSFSGEGKSFISTNVAGAIALTGKKTVLLEFDLRKPKVVEGLGMAKGPGISNFVVGKAEIKDILRPVANYDNLWIIGCGAIPPNPAELLLEDRINELFEYLKENFDAIVIDSAPVGLVTDSMTLSKFADATLYIVRHRYTMKKQIRLIDELFTTNKLPKLSIVINDVVGSTGGYYGYGGYGYGYGRQYGYGYGYFEEAKPRWYKNLWIKLKRAVFFWRP
jgi:tyrosine-protein kinase Etk/Wzc